MYGTLHSTYNVKFTIMNRIKLLAYKGTMSAAMVLSLAMGVSSCSYNQFAGVATGSSLGGMLGSSIGGLMGGPRGADRGTLAGMIIGGAVGAAATAPHTPKAATQNDSYAYGNDTPSSGNDVQYGTYNNPRYKSAVAAHSDLQSLEVSNIHFLDDNNNQRLDADEQACIVFDIYNRGSRTLYNVAPNIVCSNKRVGISPAATVASVLPGQGIRYKATIVAPHRLKGQPLRFTISFGTGKQAVVVKEFSI